MKVRKAIRFTGHADARSSCGIARRAWLGLLAPLGLLAVTSASAQPPEPLPLFVSILPQRQIVERVGGGAVRVHVLVRPGQDAHTYEPTPAQAVSLSRAAAFFRIGMPFEENLIPKLQRSHPKLVVVDTRNGITVQTVRDHEHGHEHKQGHGREKDGSAPASDRTVPDPHIWTSPPLVKQQAATVRDALIALQPSHRERFQAGYAAYARELDALDAELRRLLAGKSGRRFMVFHPSWGYLASTYGLEQVAIEVDGKQPTPKMLASIIDRAKADGIRVIFVQPQFSRTAAEQVARAIGGEVVAIDPLAEDLVGNLLRVGQVLARALQ